MIALPLASSGGDGASDLLDLDFIHAGVEAWLRGEDFPEEGPHEGEEVPEVVHLLDEVTAEAENPHRILDPAKVSDAATVSDTQVMDALLEGISDRGVDASQGMNRLPVEGMDRVLAKAVTSQVITKHELQQWMNQHGLTSWPAWRTVCTWLPDRAHAIERTAAAVFGYRPVLICQVSTLILADMLAERVADERWQNMISSAIIPVVEHGHAPTLEGRIVCVTNDPSSEQVASIIDSIQAFEPDLAYADIHHVRAMSALLQGRRST